MDCTNSWSAIRLIHKSELSLSQNLTSLDRQTACSNYVPFNQSQHMSGLHSHGS